MRLKLLCLTLCAAFLVGVIPQFTSTEAKATSGITIYVSQEGQDTNSGSFESPLKTLNAAREKVRVLKESGAGDTATVYIRGGEYYLNRSFLLNNLDSNTNYVAYAGEDVAIKGSTVLDNSKFRKVTDNEVLAHFPDHTIAEKVLQYNLNSNGIKQKAMNYRGSKKPSWVVDGTNPQELVINDKTQTVARYPNKGYAVVRSVSDWGSKGADAASSTGFTFKFDNIGSRHWDKADRAMIYGHFVNGWEDRTVTINSVNHIDGSITTNEPYITSIAIPEKCKDGRYYIFNLLEELDTSGEYYIDSDKSILYLYPSETFATDKIELTTLQQPLLKISNASNITFSGIDFINGNNFGIVITNCDNVCIKDGAVKNLARMAVDIQKSTNCGIDGLTIENVHGGVYIQNCGNLETLTPGNCYCKNTRIKEYATAAYTAGIKIVDGVGNIISNNEISDSDHMAIGFSGNENIIEYNDIHDVLRCTTDSGAIYVGQSWTSRGNQVRYNYIHDISSDMTKGSPCVGIYFDDGFCSADTYGNIIDNFVGIGIFINGGKDFNIYNNIINSTKAAVLAKLRDYGTKDYTTVKGYTNLIKSPYRSELWRERYPTLYTILDDKDKVLLPTGNSIYNNLSIKSSLDLRDEVINDAVQIGPNLVSTTVELDENYQVPQGSDVFTTLPGFENIQFENIGIK